MHILNNNFLYSVLILCKTQIYFAAENGEQDFTTLPCFRPLHSNGKIVCTTAASVSLSVQIIAHLPDENNPRSTSVPTIQTVKGRVVFFRKVREKISTLKPLTVWIFAVTISPPKTGNRIKKSCPAFVRFILTAKPSTLLRRLSVGYAVALPPRPRPLPKNRMECYAIGLEKA